MWAFRIITEFNTQTAKEEQLGLPVSQMLLVGVELDSVKKHQMSFIDFMILPLWSSLCEALPEIQEAKDELDKNRETWRTLATLA